MCVSAYGKIDVPLPKKKHTKYYPNPALNSSLQFLDFADFCCLIYEKSFACSSQICKKFFVVNYTQF